MHEETIPLMYSATDTYNFPYILEQSFFTVCASHIFFIPSYTVNLFYILQLSLSVCLASYICIDAVH